MTHASTWEDLVIPDRVAENGTPRTAVESIDEALRLLDYDATSAVTAAKWQVANMPLERHRDSDRRNLTRLIERVSEAVTHAVGDLNGLRDAIVADAEEHETTEGE